MNQPETATIWTTVENSSYPEYGVIKIPFPIPRESYDSYMEKLRLMEIADPLKQDCRVVSVLSNYSVLKQLEVMTVNVDELDYLAKRLESFDVGEAAQFQAMAYKMELFELKDLINLTFCCQQATVTTDFSDLEQVGRDHYMNLHGSCAPTKELKQLNGAETVKQLIDSGTGVITPYGVVFDNGMKLEQHYDGNHFPAYHHDRDVLMIGLTSHREPENTENITWIYLPTSQMQLNRAIARSGIAPEDIRLSFSDSQFPDEVDVRLDFRRETMDDLNNLALAVEKLSQLDWEKLGAVVDVVKPECASEIRQLAENLDQFDFAPGAHTPEEYGKYMIRSSGHFEYDENLDEFYDFERYGQLRMAQEDGAFTDRGYVSYHGTMTLDELMRDDPAETLRRDEVNMEMI